MPSPSLADEYIASLDATAISIVTVPSGFAFRVGRKTSSIEGVASTHWVTRSHAAKIARNARASAGAHPDKRAAERALQVAAHAERQVLTPHVVFVSRATFMSKRLAATLRDMDRSGQLTLFHKEYKRRREAAKARRQGFMSHSAALIRLRRCLIRRLVESIPVNTPGLFEMVFDYGKRPPPKKNP